jgi:hypothetical protein
MTQAKIQGKFYPLQHSEWLRACHELTPAQRDVLYFIRTLDPYGEGLDLSIAEIARQLSTPAKTVHRSTISRALKELDTKGFIDMDLIQVNVTIKGKGIHCTQTIDNERDHDATVLSQDNKRDHDATVLPQDNSRDHDATVLSQDNKRDHDATVLSQDNSRDHDATVLSQDNERDHDATGVIMTQQARSPRNNRASEPAPVKKSGSLRSNKTYKDFKDSLSDSEREKFLEFSLNKASQLPKPPTLAVKWIEKHYQELYDQFKHSPEGKILTSASDWANHPKRDEWIAEIRIGRPRFVALGGPEEERETRRQFAKWAEENNLVWGVES